MSEKKDSDKYGRPERFSTAASLSVNICSRIHLAAELGTFELDEEVTTKEEKMK